MTVRANAAPLSLRWHNPPHEGPAPVAELRCQNRRSRRGASAEKVCAEAKELRPADHSLATRTVTITGRKGAADAIPGHADRPQPTVPGQLSRRPRPAATHPGVPTRPVAISPEGPDLAPRHPGQVPTRPRAIPAGVPTRPRAIPAGVRSGPIAIPAGVPTRPRAIPPEQLGRAEHGDVLRGSSEARCTGVPVSRLPFSRYARGYPLRRLPRPVLSRSQIGYDLKPRRGSPKLTNAYISRVRCSQIIPNQVIK
jgi:hypothetical protein